MRLASSQLCHPRDRRSDMADFMPRVLHTVPQSGESSASFSYYPVLCLHAGAVGRITSEKVDLCAQDPTA